MLAKIVDFIKYNNAFTIIFVIIFFGTGVAFAADEDIRESVYASEEKLVSVDNSLILSSDFDNFDFQLMIGGVTEDDKNYYAEYSYDTLAIIDGAWQRKKVEKTLTVSKDELNGRDLGLYIAEELGENVRGELAYLKRVQKIETEKGESQKIVTVEYSGLVGKMIDPKSVVIEGYEPVIPEPVKEEEKKETPPEETVVSTVIILNPNNEQGEPEDNTPPVDTTPEAIPPAEELVDEELVQEVVEELLEEASSSPKVEAVDVENPVEPVTEEAPQEAPAEPLAE